jgi:flagellar hook-associated protein 1 FlgK
MSFNVSMSNALSGLTASARAAEVVSSNVANAMTDGYGRREVVLSARTGGVQVVSVQRISDATIRSDRREAESGFAAAQTLSGSLQRIETEIGLPAEPGSLSSQLAAFDKALLEAASHPNAEARLDAVLRGAQGLTGSFNRISDRIQQERTLADQGISLAVEQVNDALQKVEDLNTQIFKLDNLGRDANALIDQRQAVIDDISELIPVREVARDGNRVALFTPTGGVLVDGRASKFEFDITSPITAEMTFASGALNGLSLNGQSLKTAGQNSQIAGGKLAALFSIRDEIAPNAQAGIDAIARNLIQRFEDPAMDSTLSVGDAGLFADGISAFDPANEVGLAGRLSVNLAVDPDAGGAVWRLRDGMNAAAPGAAGDNRLLTAMSVVLEDTIVPASGPFMGVARHAAGLIGDYLSSISSERQSSDGTAAYQSARADTLIVQELQGGVDTDQEMQKLLLIEQAYAANARVLQTLDQLLEQLLRI